MLKSTFSQRSIHFMLIFGVTLLAAWFRLWRLTDVPPGFWSDEAYDAMDTIWMRDALSPQIFLVANNGREPMFHYLGLLSMSIFGMTSFAFRLVSALLGIFTIPLIYFWLVNLFAQHPDRRWLALIATTGLAFSFWH